MTKLIKNWQELAQVPPSDTHYLDISIHNGNGMIVTKKPKSNKHRDKYDYLSTHTFYGGEHKRSTARLQACGFDVEIDNWEKMIMTNEEIIQNAPDGPEDWSHVADNQVQTYLKLTHNKNVWWDGERWFQLHHPLPSIRSRRDIERIVELEAESEKLKQERVELASHNEKLMLVSWEMKEGVSDAFYKIKDCRSDTGKNILAKRDLEQQAKALENFVIPNLSYEAFKVLDDARIEQASQLRKQASEVSE